MSSDYKKNSLSLPDAVAVCFSAPQVETYRPAHPGGALGTSRDPIGHLVLGKLHRRLPFRQKTPDLHVRFQLRIGADCHRQLLMYSMAAIINSSLSP